MPYIVWDKIRHEGRFQHRHSGQHRHPTGVPRSQETTPSWNSSVGLYLASHGCPRGVGVSYERGTPAALPNSLPYAGFLFHRRPYVGYPSLVLGAIASFLEPFCGNLSPKIDKVSEELTLRYPHEGPWVVTILQWACWVCGTRTAKSQSPLKARVFKSQTRTYVSLQSERTQGFAADPVYVKG